MTPTGISPPVRIAALAGFTFWTAFAALASAQNGAESDRRVLEVLYDATGGASWTDRSNWKTAAPLGEWHGVTTDPAGRVTRLHLDDNGLVGSLPPVLGSLLNIESLDFALNAIDGPIPSELGNLVNLQRLNLYGNALAGPIPPALGNLVRLRWLFLRRNALTGPIPRELASMVNLQGLYLDENDLTGPIPAELGSLMNLQGLYLGENALVGSIPGQLGTLADLKWLDLGGNALSGPIPSQLESLMNVERLDLSWNPLTGTLPQRLIQLSRLTRLDISRTAACAPADAAFQEWLATIDFAGDTCNRAPQPVGTIPTQALTQSGPARGVSLEAYFSDPDGDPLIYSATSSRADTVTVLVSGVTVWLVPGAAGTAAVTVTARDPDGLDAVQTVAATTVASDGPGSDREVLEALYDATGGAGWTNRTNWKTAAQLGEWHGVTTDTAGRVTGLELVDNGLVGSIPPALGNLENLERLDLGSNALAGPIPGELGRPANLKSLFLGGNVLTGSIPGELGSLSNLESLSLGGNRLTGRVPAWVGRLTGLQWLDLAGNVLTGPIPDELGSLVNLERLELSDNALTGPAPAWVGRLTGLRLLFLSGNALTGPLPRELGNLVNLEWLDLRENALTGPVPPWLGNLTKLRWLELGGNALTGPVPVELGRLTNLKLLDLSYTWGVSGPLPPGLRLPRLEDLDIFVAQACAPSGWRDWLATIEFTGRLCEAGTDVTIDVAVVYTPAAREAAGGAAATEAMIDLMIAEANQAYEASGVHHRLAVVDRSEVSYVETGDAYLDLVRLSDPSDGHMDGVHGLRDRVGADLVHLIVDESSACGIALIAGAFGLTQDVCGGATVAHELGHNMGLRHDRYQVYHGEDGLSPHPAYGYVNQRAFEAGSARSSRWRTIMSYHTQCDDAYALCPVLLRFSNPRQRYNGDPLGTPFGGGWSEVSGPADATAVLDATGPAVAAWRDHVRRGPNRPPVAVGALPDRRLALRGTLDVDVSRAFVDPDEDALSYTVSSSTPQVVTASIAGARVTLTAVSEGASTIRVTATDPGGLGATQSFTVTVSTTVSGSFTDDPIQPGVTPVRAVHFRELRSRIDALRAGTGLGRFAWTDPVLRAGVTPVRRVHLLELRSALAEAYSAAGRAAPRWTDASPVGGSTPIRAAHVTELRAAVLALE